MNHVEGANTASDCGANGSRGEFCLGSFCVPSCAICDASMRRDKIRLYACAGDRQLVLELDFEEWE